MGNNPSDPAPTDRASGKDGTTDGVNHDKPAVTRKGKTNVREHLTIFIFELFSYQVENLSEVITRGALFDSMLFGPSLTDFSVIPSITELCNIAARTIVVIPSKWFPPSIVPGVVSIA